jgi:hypothetical protein
MVDHQPWPQGRLTPSRFNQGQSACRGPRRVQDCDLQVQDVAWAMEHIELVAQAAAQQLQARHGHAAAASSSAAAPHIAAVVAELQRFEEDAGGTAAPHPLTAAACPESGSLGAGSRRASALSPVLPAPRQRQQCAAAALPVGSEREAAAALRRVKDQWEAVRLRLPPASPALGTAC